MGGLGLRPFTVVVVVTVVLGKPRDLDESLSLCVCTAE